MRKVPQNQHQQILLYARLRQVAAVLLAPHQPCKAQEDGARADDEADNRRRRKTDEVGRPGLEHAEQLGGGLAVLVEASRGGEGRVDGLGGLARRGVVEEVDFGRGLHEEGEAGDDGAPVF